ncbi:hypothetical protein Q765_18815 [Flavobacterium rivuli WB 3.3-2 = DSM 21788]|uniref:Uncharacterized protein n=1 Tax=Flavobacterium rivuli WB 3.3-2 = DSM 21788 TaxID=1121895 RepID=A0A0A2M9I8_9FLAO|nr:hypothetical protein Q765_18815 [Flavobacterium rivuli WB 3.3-2 = DSM 21788]
MKFTTLRPKTQDSTNQIFKNIKLNLSYEMSYFYVAISYNRNNKKCLQIYSAGIAYYIIANSFLERSKP